MNESAEATEPRGGGRSTWLVGAIVALVLVVVAAAAMAIVGGREDTDYSPDSPEAAFQAYARAWDAGDTDAAWDMLTASAQGRVSRWEFREANNWRDGEAQRIWIDGRTGTDDRSTLELTIETRYDGGLIGADRWDESTRVTMIRVEDEWKIDTPLVGYQRW